jgi:hypothetical protein
VLDLRNGAEDRELNRIMPDQEVLRVNAKETLKVLANVLVAIQPAEWLPSLEAKSIISDSQVKVLWRDYIDRRTELIVKMWPLAGLLLDDLTRVMEQTKGGESE